MPVPYLICKAGAVVFVRIGCVGIAQHIHKSFINTSSCCSQKRPHNPLTLNFIYIIRINSNRSLGAFRIGIITKFRKPDFFFRQEGISVGNNVLELLHQTVFLRADAMCAVFRIMMKVQHISREAPAAVVITPKFHTTHIFEV